MSAPERPAREIRPGVAPEPPASARGDAAVWDALQRWRAAGRRFVLATVTESRGFTPRKAGAHMLVDEAGATVGTIGGGAIEREVLEQARALLASGGSAQVERHLTRELGMCCGGEMAVFLEVVEPAPRLLLFGAGYIASALAAVAASCGFEVVVVDERPEWADPARFPGAEVHAREPEAWLRAQAGRADDFAVVVTHDHALDQRLVQELLRRPLRFVGMIGSIPKQRKFALRLRARGFSETEIARLHTPLGLSIGADTPEEIAVSVMAELIAVRRGMRPAAGAAPGARTTDRPGAADRAGHEVSTEDPKSRPATAGTPLGKEQETS